MSKVSCSQRISQPVPRCYQVHTLKTSHLGASKLTPPTQPSHPPPTAQETASPQHHPTRAGTPHPSPAPPTTTTSHAGRNCSSRPARVTQTACATSCPGTPTPASESASSTRPRRAGTARPRCKPRACTSTWMLCGCFSTLGRTSAHRAGIISIGMLLSMRVARVCMPFPGNGSPVHPKY